MFVISFKHSCRAHFNPSGGGGGVYSSIGKCFDRFLISAKMVEKFFLPGWGGCPQDRWGGFQWKVENGKWKINTVIASVAKQSSQNIQDCHNFALRMPASYPLLWGGRSCACTSKLQMRGGGSSRRDEVKMYKEVLC